MGGIVGGDETMKTMDLVPKDDNQFKIDDTNTLLHFQPLLDNKDVALNNGLWYFVIKQKDAGFIQTAKAVIDGNMAVLNSNELKGLPVGTYELELWHQNEDKSTDIFPNHDWLDFKVNQNAYGDVHQTINQPTAQQLYEDVTNKVQAFIDNAKQQIANLKPKDGEPGNDGVNATIKLMPVVQEDPNTAPSVKNLGTDTNAMLEFHIPKASSVRSFITEDNADLDNYKTEAHLFGNAMRIQNCASSGFFTLDVKEGQNATVQDYFDVANNHEYTRTFINGKWSEWQWVTAWN
ncbi:hypothetical protein FC35_GL000693 [Limosilactobacillus coleohominis DSM 14060]|nr:hypothetical protein FC35_GL000693 [Limosilactobacillus coleohominis DSM 14060]